jgi:hypothetical protein
MQRMRGSALRWFVTLNPNPNMKGLTMDIILYPIENPSFEGSCEI